jgi:hypothetical protein
MPKPYFRVEAILLVPGGRGTRLCFITPTGLELRKNLYREVVVEEMSEMALAVFYQLEEPGGHDEDGRRIDPEVAGRKVP